MITQNTDSEIKKNILDELKWDAKVKETDIGVIVKNGAVTLTGNVPFYYQKNAAVKAAKRIKGVRVVADEIEIKFTFESEGSDKDIAEHIAKVFEWNTMIPASIKAEVKDGVVILSGDADWQFERRTAQKQVEDVKGVKLVLNNINLRKRASASDVKKEITRALHRHANIESSEINVSVVDGTVTLSGDVDNYVERDLVENAAWSASGVSKVIDNLCVDGFYSEAA